MNASFDAWALLEIGRELKEAVCRTSDSPLGGEGDSAAKLANLPLLPYELPDGTHLDVGNERFQPSELFFDTSPLDVNDPYLNLLGLNPLENIKLGRTSVFASLDSLPRLMCDSVLRAENQDAQASLCGNIVLAGGVSCLDGTAERVKTELERVLHSTMPQWKVKTISTGESERAVCTWLGGSILASLGSFHEMWLSRQEYEEYGPNYVDRKCP
jgi:actin-related protein